jgi:DNA-binding HxlR family transcriptional regulator
MGMADFNGIVNNIQDTPFGYTMSVIGGKWKMVIIYLLAENQPVRFNEMQRQIGTITYKILSSQLKELEADGLVRRKEYP